MALCGIYKIQSKEFSDRCYIGSSYNIKRRKNVHYYLLRHNKHFNKKLQNHYNKYGEDDLSFNIVVGCSKEKLRDIEQFFMESFKSYFNINKDTRCPDFTGHKVSEEHKKKLSICMLGNKNGSGNKGKRILIGNRSRSIIQYDKNNNFVSKYSSAKRASEITGIGRTSINNNLTKRAKSAGGYIWQYSQ
jgi:hypothetical protein